MTDFHSEQYFLDMEGVHSSNLCASTTLKPNQNSILQREAQRFFSSFNTHHLAHFSPEHPQEIGANVGNRIATLFNRFGDSTTHETSLSDLHFLTSLKNRKSILEFTGGRL